MSTELCLPLRSTVGRFIVPLARGVLGMPDPATDSVIIKFDVEDPIALDDVIGGFSALSSQYKRSLSALGYDGEKANVRLYVSRISDGCIEAELAVYALLFREAISAMDYANIMSDFTNRMGRIVGFFSGKNERPADLKKSDIKDAAKFLDSVADRDNPRINLKKARYHEKDGSREQVIEIEYDIDREEIVAARNAIERELAVLEDGDEHKTRRNVLFVWEQLNRGKGRSSGRTGDQAVIQAISDKPKPVFFPKGSDSIKRAMTQTDGNPMYGRGYMVDVDVQYYGDEPKVYTVLEVHAPIDLDDD